MAVAFFGDGAANEGAFHEALNLAAVWKLPVVFVCENNLYGFSTHYRRVTVGGGHRRQRAAGYGMPGRWSTAWTPQAVYEAAGEGVARARAGRAAHPARVQDLPVHGALALEPSSYRTQEELEEWNEAGPHPGLAWPGCVCGAGACREAETGGRRGGGGPG